jgi:hypothetical protein
MAKIETKLVLVKISKLVKDDEKAEFDSINEVTRAFEAITQEICGNGVVAEVEVVDD